MNYRKFLIAALLVMSFSVQAKDITVTRLTCEMREGRVTISDAPRLGWQMSSPENGTRQTAYEIEVRDVWAGKVVWNSGKVKSARSQLVSCADAALEKDRHYTWRVRVWDEADTLSAWSAPSDFSILTSEAAFAGSEWIGAITRKDARIPEGRKYHGSELKKPEAVSYTHLSLNSRKISNSSSLIRMGRYTGSRLPRRTRCSSAYFSPSARCRFAFRLRTAIL